MNTPERELDERDYDQVEIDEDTLFEEQRQERIDEQFRKRVSDDVVKALPDIMMLKEQA